MLTKKHQDNARLDEIIEKLELDILENDPESETYTTSVNHLETLYQLRNGQKPPKTELKDWIPVIGSVGGIVTIVMFEAFGHTVISKGLSFVSKLKN